MSAKLKKALLVIDAQNVYTSKSSELYCKDSAKTIQRINQLIDRCHANGDAIIYVRHVHRVDGSDVGRMFDYMEDGNTEFNFKAGTEEVDYDARLSRPAQITEIIKSRYSCFAGTNLAAELAKRKITKVVVCGFMTNFCCESTARQAHDSDYFVDFVIDATGTPGTENINEKKMREIVQDKMVAGIARVMSTKQWLAEFPAP